MRDITDGGDFYFAADVLNQHRNFPRGTVVVGTSGLKVSSDGTDMTLDITAGDASIDNTSQSLTSSTVTLAAADTFERYDLVVVEDNGGTYETTTVTGTQAKTTPTLQPTQVLLAIVRIPSGATTISSGNVLDARLMSTSTENDGTFNTLQVQTAPSADQDVVRKLELDTKSAQGHDHSTETISPATVENGDYTWTNNDLMIGQNITDNGGSNKVGLGVNATVGGEDAVGIGSGVTADSSGATAVGTDATSTSTNGTAIGKGTGVDGTDSTAVGSRASATALYSTALGMDAVAKDEGGIAIGRDATVDSGTGSDYNLAIGAGAEILQGTDALAIGRNAVADNQEVVSIGNDISVSGSWAVGVGRNASITGSEAVGLGRDTNVTSTAGVAIGPYANVATDNVGHIAVDQLKFGAINGTIPDAELDNQEMTIDADEANSQFQIRYKDSSGSIQTGTLTFD